MLDNFAHEFLLNQVLFIGNIIIFSGVYLKLVDSEELESFYQRGKYSQIVERIEAIGYSQEITTYFYYYVSSYIELGNLHRVEFLLDQFDPENITPENVILWHLLKGKYLNAQNEFSLSLNELELALKFCPLNENAQYRTEILLELAKSLDGLGKPFLAFNVAFQAFLLIHKSQHDFLLAQTYNLLGILNIRTKEYKKARFFLKKSLILYENLHHHHGRAYTLFNLSTLFYKQKQFYQAQYLGERAFTILQNVGNPYIIVCVSIRLGEIHFALNQSLIAGKYLHNAQIIAEKIGNPEYVAQALVKLGWVYKNQNKYKESLQYYQKALTLLELNEQSTSLSLTLYHLGIIYQIQKDYSSALQAFRRCLRIREQLGNTEAICKVLLKISIIKYLIGEKKEALQILIDAHNIIGPTKNVNLKLHTLVQTSFIKYSLNMLDASKLILDDVNDLKSNINHDLINNYGFLINAIYELNNNNCQVAEHLLIKSLKFNGFGLNEYNLINKFLIKIFLINWYETNDQNVLEKLIFQLSIWDKYSKTNNLGDCMVQICLIRGLLSVLTGKVEEAERRLTQCSIASEEMGLQNHKRVFEKEIDFLTEISGKPEIINDFAIRVGIVQKILNQLFF